MLIEFADNKWDKNSIFNIYDTLVYQIFKERTIFDKMASYSVILCYIVRKNKWPELKQKNYLYN